MKRLASVVIFVSVVPASAFAAFPTPVPARVAFTSTRDGNHEIYRMNFDGSSPSRLTNNPAADIQPAVARDGRIAFVSDRDGNNEIYVMSASGTNQIRLTNDPGNDSQPAWSPDGTRIAFVSTRNASFDVFVMNADGTGVSRLTTASALDVDPVFSPDGDTIFFVSNRDGNHEVYSMNADGSAETRITNNTLFESRPDVSPNGTKLVVNRNVPSGGGLTQHVVIMDIDGTGEVVLTTAGSNSNPAFGANGRRIFFDSFRDGNHEIYSMLLDGTDQVRLTANTASDIQATSPSLVEIETVGVYRPAGGDWRLKRDGSLGLDFVIDNFGGQAGDLPVSGDWNGDARTDIGFFRDGVFHLGILGAAGISTTVDALPPFVFGQAGDLPLAGDWDGNGRDDVGVFRPGTPGRMFLRVPAQSSVSQITFVFGTAGDLPIAGDWNGDGIDTPGVLHIDENTNGVFQLTNSFANVIDRSIFLGGETSLPVAGDWLGTGKDSIGVYLGSAQVFVILRTLDDDLKSAQQIPFGQPGDMPVAGGWSP